MSFVQHGPDHGPFRGFMDAHHYSIAVAVFDYLPTLLSGAALFLLTLGIAARQPRLGLVAAAAAAAITAGGLCKASWKLLLATRGVDLPWLSHALFIALAPGFVAMSFCMFHARPAALPSQPRLARLMLWLALPLLAGSLSAAFASNPRLWFFVLLAITTVANAMLILHAVIACRRLTLPWPTMTCLLYSFTATLTLSGLARLPAGETTAWVQEAVNLSAQVALLCGFWRLGRRLQETL